MIRASRAVTTVSVLAMLGATVALSNPAGADPAQTLTCGSTVTRSTILANDVGPCPGDGLIIGADNVVLDLNGHSVFGTMTTMVGQPVSSSQSAGIRFSSVTNSMVRNGEVYNFAAGVAINGGSSNQVTDLNVHDNIGNPAGSNFMGDGIDLFGSNHNLIHKNLVVHNGPYSGISLLSSVPNSGSDGASYNTVADNTIRDNDIPFYNPDGTPGWKSDVGIRVEGPGSTNNVLEQNTITGSGTNGIEVYPSCDNGYAAKTMGCAGSIPNDYNVIRSNVSNDNGFAAPTFGPPGDGILLLSMGPHMVLQPYHNTVENNTTNGNERNGVDVGSGNGAGSHGGPMGCTDEPIPCGVNYNTVDHNTAVGNHADGLYVGNGSKYNMIGENSLYNNNLDGIEVDLYSSNNTLTHNTGLGNTQYDGADNNPGCDSNTWDHNDFKTVSQPCV